MPVAVWLASAERLRRRFRWVLTPVAIAGALFCIGMFLAHVRVGAWPMHDSVAYWIAGVDLRAGEPVYEITPYLAFLYAPPMAVLMAPLSLLPLDWFVGGLLVLQVLAFRYVVGSWRNVGLIAWLPIVMEELVSGNIDFLIAAAILASIRNVRGAGYFTALMGATKLSSTVTMLTADRRQWREANVAGLVLIALTVPTRRGCSGSSSVARVARDAYRQQSPGVQPIGTIPLLPRIPLGVLRIAYRRPSSVAAGAAMLVPAFYAMHSILLFLPAMRLASTSRVLRFSMDRPRSPLVLLLRRRSSEGSVRQSRSPGQNSPKRRWRRAISRRRLRRARRRSERLAWRPRQVAGRSRQQ